MQSFHCKNILFKILLTPIQTNKYIFRVYFIYTSVYLKMLYSKCSKLYCKNKILIKISKGSGNENHQIHRNILPMNTDFLLQNRLFIKLICQFYRYEWMLSYKYFIKCWLRYFFVPLMLSYMSYNVFLWLSFNALITNKYIIYSIYFVVIIC